MKLNNKGYMLVEIVVASVLAMSIGYYILNLTYKFKDKADDIYYSYQYQRDKILITKNIMNDLEKGAIVKVDNFDDSSNFISFDFNYYDEAGELNEEKRKLEITNNIIKYGKIDKNTGIFILDDISYYEKVLDSSLIVSNFERKIIENNLFISLKLQSIYSDNDYSIKLTGNYDSSTPIVANINYMAPLFDNNDFIYFKQDAYRENIKKVYFVSYIDTSSAMEAWDMSLNNDGSIMAWINKSNGNSYSLYIGSKDEEIYAESLQYFFSDMGGLTTLNLSNLNTSETTNMQGMFENCSNLQEIDLSSFDTSNVDNMTNMFADCTNLKTLNIENWDVQNVKATSGMFASCDKLKDVDLSNLDLSSIEQMGEVEENGTTTYGMFYNCKKISIELTITNVSNINMENYKGVFDGAATTGNSKIIINYTSETKDFVEELLNNSTDYSNITTNLIYV